MKTTVLVFLFMSAIWGRGIDGYDTTVTLMRNQSRPDSIFIYPLGQNLYFDIWATVSCSGYIGGDFASYPYLEPIIERIPEQAASLIHITHGYFCMPEPTQVPETTFTFADRYYKVKSRQGDVYFKVAGISYGFI